jgi:hypothetical protein
MRGTRRYFVHTRLLFAFLLVGSLGSFVLGQEIARAVVALPVYAEQSLTFSGAGLAASLTTPLQASGAIGKPTPTPQPPTKPRPKKRSTPTIHTAPVVLRGSPITVDGPKMKPCANAPCDPTIKPAPPVRLPPAQLPPAQSGGTSVTAPAAAPGVTPARCPPLGLISLAQVPASPAICNLPEPVAQGSAKPAAKASHISGPGLTPGTKAPAPVPAATLTPDPLGMAGGSTLATSPAQVTISPFGLPAASVDPASADPTLAPTPLPAPDQATPSDQATSSDQATPSPQTQEPAQ